MYCIYINDEYKKGFIVSSFEEIYEQIVELMSPKVGDEIHIYNEVTQKDVTDKAMAAIARIAYLKNEIEEITQIWED